MNQQEINDRISSISAENDLLKKSLRLAGLVTALFRENGYELVVVGGAAIEFYTEGSYMSGDIDFCRRSAQPIPPRIEQCLMGKMGGVGGPRSWECAGMFVDILGFLENDAMTPLSQLETPDGLGYTPKNLNI